MSVRVIPMPSQAPLWKKSPACFPALIPYQIHIWRLRVEDRPSCFEDLLQTLSPDEQARALRFRTQRHRNRFAVCRAVLRYLLGHYLDCEPSQLRLAYTHYGKPFLEERASRRRSVSARPDASVPPAHRSKAEPKNFAAAPGNSQKKAGGLRALQFNVTHSQQLALYAFSAEAALGIDVEHIRPLSYLEALARRHLSTAEYADFCAAPALLKEKAFFYLWTAKEARLKVRGLGLSQPLHDAGTLPDSPNADKNQGRCHGPHLPQAWLYSFAAAPGYAGALAAEGKKPELRFFDFDSHEWTRRQKPTTSR